MPHWNAPPCSRGKNPRCRRPHLRPTMARIFRSGDKFGVCFWLASPELLSLGSLRARSPRCRWPCFYLHGDGADFVDVLVVCIESNRLRRIRNLVFFVSAGPKSPLLLLPQRESASSSFPIRVVPLIRQASSEALGPPHQYRYRRVCERPQVSGWEDIK